MNLTTTFQTAASCILLLLPLACDDGGSGDTGAMDGDSDADSDSSSDSADAPTPYDDFDCDGRGLDQANCEYWLCQNREFHVTEAASCSAGDPACNARLVCYDDYLTCMAAACPPGTAAPADHDGRSEAGFYVCDNDMSTCMLYAEN